LAARSFWREFRKNRLAVAGLVIVVGVVAAALLAGVVAPYDPIRIDTRHLSELSLLSPSFQHPMGTDLLGRDLFSRVLFGARVSLLIGVAATAIMIVLGVVSGAIAGYFGGRIDGVIMRTADVFFAFPYVLGAIVLITVLGFGIQNIFIAIGVLGWPLMARLFRSSVLSVRERPFVAAARISGASHTRVLLRHVVPNALAPVIVFGTMSVGGAILAEAALSFLGIGVQPPTPAWGFMVSESRSFMTTAPWLMLFPGLAILLTVLGFVFLGDGLRDALDPRLRSAAPAAGASFVEEDRSSVPGRGDQP